MFIINEKSYETENPVFQKITSNEKNKPMFVPDYHLAKECFTRGYYESNYIDWVSENFVNKNSNIIDIGAHMGWYSIKLANKVKHVYSFECSPRTFNYLCANIALNNQDYNITKYNCALGEKESLVKYYIRDYTNGGGNGVCELPYDSTKNTPTIDVPMKTLDSFNLENINFIKIDVEGYEKQVLQGAIKTIKSNNYPKILFESWSSFREKENVNSIELRKELFEYISSIGYKIVTLGDKYDEMFLAEKK